MFNKLRNKILVLNMIIIFVLMLLAFGSIYLITYNDVQKTIRSDLNKLSEINKHDNDRNYLPSDKKTEESIYDIPDNSRITDNNFIPSVSFVITVDKQWEITRVVSFFYIEDSFYEESLLLVNQNKEYGQYKLNGNSWAYLIRPFADGYNVFYLDVTSQKAVLTKIIFTFLIVALIMLFVIFIVSYFLTNRSIQPVREAFNKQKQFVADASHELKTPLTVINTNADALLTHSEDIIKNQVKWIQYIKSETKRMAKLTNDLLYLTQVDYSDEKLVFSKFNISSVTESVILTMEAVMFEKHIKLGYEIEPDITIYGNQEQISQVIMILLDNAAAYTNQEGVVKVNLYRQSHYVYITVENSGEGIAEEHIKKIFDRFYRADKSRSRKKGKYGLGLAIAKSIIKQHNGRISVKSIINEKTVFTVQLLLTER